MPPRPAVPLRGRSVKSARLNEFRKNSLWLVPSIAVVVAIGASTLALSIDEGLAEEERASGVFFATSVEDARQVVATVAAAMLTFMGVVFSITLVALQLASTQYSPRVVRSFVRSPATKWTLAVFIATFTFAFNTLTSIDSATDYVPVTSVLCTYVLVMTSLFVFIAFVHRIVKAMRVTYVIEAIARETRRAVELAQERTASFPPVSAPTLGEPSDDVRLHGRPGVIGGIDTLHLVHLAREHGAVFRIPHLVGDFLPHDAVLVEVHGGGTRPSDLTVRRAFELGPERTLYQDPAYGIRQLVDMAIRALSPAVNDPTTAVQVVDRLLDLLRRISVRPMPAGVYVDDGDVVRLVRPVMTWERYVDLAFTEISHFGAASPQVTRRLEAAYQDLLAYVPPDRQEPVRRQEERLAALVAAKNHEEGVVFALAPDPMGLG
jgi:uncharacterized membrane protein